LKEAKMQLQSSQRAYNSVSHRHQYTNFKNEKNTLTHQQAPSHGGRRIQQQYTPNFFCSRSSFVVRR